MIGRNIFLFAVGAVLMSQVPSLLGLTDISEPVETTQATAPSAPPSPARLAAISADDRGHFNAVFRINGRPVEGMIDTGASLVALNESTARRIGIAGSRLQFEHQVSTANGKTEAAHVVLDEVELQGVRVRQVDAFVLRDTALSSTLVGMSFLKKLTSFRVDRGTLKLSQ